jgi:hypothetical protein
VRAPRNTNCKYEVPNCKYEVLPTVRTFLFLFLFFIYIISYFRNTNCKYEVLPKVRGYSGFRVQGLVRV